MIFVDTSFWIGLGDDRDDRHADALALFHAESARPLITTNHVMAELWTFVRRRYDHAHAVRFVDQIEGARRLQIQFVGAALEREAWAWLRRHDERKYSFVDATSFALMKHLRISDAYAFDDDFAAAGFVALRA